jgi:hypothetical protein
VNEIEAFDRTRRDYYEVAGLYEDLVRRGDEVTDALSTAMINAFADLVQVGDSRGCSAGRGVRPWAVDRSPGSSGNSGSRDRFVAGHGRDRPPVSSRPAL